VLHNAPWVIDLDLPVEVEEIRKERKA
jgi:hypothetical protein